MQRIRRPAVAGMFYPDQPEQLHAQVLGYIRAAAQAAAPGQTAPKAIIAPHAGYIYSGSVAGSAYARLMERAPLIHRVVLLGPAHRWPVPGLAYPDADALETPLGRVPVDRDAISLIAGLPQVQAIDNAFNGEHCLEVQLPFLQTLLADFRVVPLLVGGAGTDAVSEVLESLWGGDETLIVISSDLSHYLSYDSGRAMDTRTSRAICALRPETITPEQACGRNPIAGLLKQASEHGLHAELVDLRSSGDTAGPRDRVVGYGAYVFH